MSEIGWCRSLWRVRSRALPERMRVSPVGLRPARNGCQPLANHTAYPPRAPQSGLSLAVPPPRRLSGFRLQTNWSLRMLLPFDLRVDREGRTVFEIATDQAASLDGLPLNGLCLEDAEDAVNALNRLEIACRREAGTRSTRVFNATLVAPRSELRPRRTASGDDL